jgi:hypothetical protein
MSNAEVRVAGACVLREAPSRSSSAVLHHLLAADACLGPGIGALTLLNG